MDLSKLSTPDLVALQKGQLGAVSTQGLQYIHSQMSPPPKPTTDPNPANAMEIKMGGPRAAFNEGIYQAADSAAKTALPQGLYNYLRPILAGVESSGEGLVQGMSLGNYKPDSFENQFIAQHPTANALSKIAGGAITGLATGGGVSALLPEAASGVLPALARIGANVGASGLQGYLAAPQNGQSRTQDAEDSMKSPWTLVPTIGGELASGVGGAARSLANGSAKRAVGLVGAASKNVPPDIGNRIVDAGIWGTKAGMATRVANKYAEVENNIQDLANSLEGNVSGKDLADAVRQEGDRFVDPLTGKPFSAGDEGNAAINRVADQLETKAPGYNPGSPEQTVTHYLIDSDGERVPLNSSQIPPVPSQDGAYQAPGLLRLKRLGDEQAFNQSGAMGNTYAAEAYRAQADAARGALAKMSSGEMPQALKQEQTLLLANKGLNRPVITNKNPWSFSDLIGADVGGRIGGLPGAAAGVVTEHAVLSPLIQSLWAKALQQGAAPIASGISKIADPEVLQTLLGAHLGGSAKDSPDNSTPRSPQSLFDTGNKNGK